DFHVTGVQTSALPIYFLNDESYQKFITLVEDQELVFYKSTKTQRWWIEIPFLSEINNKLKRHTLLPCMHQDYLYACNNKLPERRSEERPVGKEDIYNR